MIIINSHITLNVNIPIKSVTVRFFTVSRVNSINNKLTLHRFDDTSSRNDVAHNFYTSYSTKMQLIIKHLKNKYPDSPLDKADLSLKCNVIKNLANSARLDKLNMSFNLNAIHLFTSKIDGKEYPIYININQLTLFYGNSAEYMFNVIKANLFQENIILSDPELLDIRYYLVDKIFNCYLNRQINYMKDLYGLDYSPG